MNNENEGSYTHQQISFVKSGIRIVAGILIIVAEILGILEELT